MERRQMENRAKMVRQIAQCLRDISDEIDQKQSAMSFLRSIKRRFITIFYSFIYSYMPCHNCIRLLFSINI